MSQLPPPSVTTPAAPVPAPSTAGRTIMLWGGAAGGVVAFLGLLGQDALGLLARACRRGGVGRGRDHGGQARRREPPPADAGTAAARPFSPHDPDHCQPGFGPGAAAGHDQEAAHST